MNDTKSIEGMNIEGVKSETFEVLEWVKLNFVSKDNNRSSSNEASMVLMDTLCVLVSASTDVNFDSNQLTICKKIGLVFSAKSKIRNNLFKIVQISIEIGSAIVIYA